MFADPAILFASTDYAEIVIRMEIGNAIRRIRSCCLNYNANRWKQCVTIPIEDWLRLVQLRVGFRFSITVKPESRTKGTISGSLGVGVLRE